MKLLSQQFNFFLFCRSKDMIVVLAKVQECQDFALLRKKGCPRKNKGCTKNLGVRVFDSCLQFTCLVWWLGAICFCCCLGLASTLLCIDWFGGVGFCSTCFGCVVGVCWLGVLVWPSDGLCSAVCLILPSLALCAILASLCEFSWVFLLDVL